MNYCQSVAGIGLFCCSFSAALAESSDSTVEYSRIEEEMLLNPPGAGTSDEVIIYSRVRNNTINKAMDSQFHRIDNMMFIDTVIETESGLFLFAEDDECD